MVMSYDLNVLISIISLFREGIESIDSGIPKREYTCFNFRLNTSCCYPTAVLENSKDRDVFHEFLKTIRLFVKMYVFFLLRTDRKDFLQYLAKYFYLFLNPLLHFAIQNLIFCF